jgi:hypothetical protein
MVREADYSLPSVSRLSRQYEILNNTQLCRPPRPITRIVLLLLLVNDARTSEETLVWSSTACYMHSFTYLYVQDIRTS